MNPLSKPRGTQDICPPRSLLYQKIRQIVVEILRQNNYRPLIFPTFEVKELFTTSLGSTTDIIHKEMYTFADRKGRQLALRPEGTASVVRSVCQNRLIRESYPLKLYYWANMFRYERPQKGRYREFWQLGVELINASGIISDYQILKLTADILRGLGIEDFCFKLNYLGNNETKEKFRKKLKDFNKKTASDLCADCQRRNETNPLRVLDCLLCKNKYHYPYYRDAWNVKDSNYINELNRILDKFKLPYQYDYHLVRGLDYYTGLVFEIDLGKEKAVLGGGRYDNLYREIGGADVSALGFAIGIERLADYLEEKKILKIDQTVDIFFLAVAVEAYLDILFWKKELEIWSIERQSLAVGQNTSIHKIQSSKRTNAVGEQKYPLVVDYNLEVKKLKSLSSIIDYYQPKILVIVGEKELKSGKIAIKDCQKRQNFFVEKEKLIEWISNYLLQN